MGGVTVTHQWFPTGAPATFQDQLAWVICPPCKAAVTAEGPFVAARFCVLYKNISFQIFCLEPRAVSLALGSRDISATPQCTPPQPGRCCVCVRSRAESPGMLVSEIIVTGGGPADMSSLSRVRMELFPRHFLTPQGSPWYRKKIGTWEGRRAGDPISPLLALPAAPACPTSSTLKERLFHQQDFPLLSQPIKFLPFLYTF